MIPAVFFVIVSVLGYFRLVTSTGDRSSDSAAWGLGPLGACARVHGSNQLQPTQPAYACELSAPHAGARSRPRHEHRHNGPRVNDSSKQWPSQAAHKWTAAALFAINTHTVVTNDVPPKPQPAAGPNSPPKLLHHGADTKSHPHNPKLQQTTPNSVPIKATDPGHSVWGPRLSHRLTLLCQGLIYLRLTHGPSAPPRQHKPPDDLHRHNHKLRLKIRRLQGGDDAKNAAVASPKKDEVFSQTPSGETDVRRALPSCPPNDTSVKAFQKPASRHRRITTIGRSPTQTEAPPRHHQHASSPLAPPPWKGSNRPLPWRGQNTSAPCPPTRSATAASHPPERCPQALVPTPPQKSPESLRTGRTPPLPSQRRVGRNRLAGARDGAQADADAQMRRTAAASPTPCPGPTSHRRYAVAVAPPHLTNHARFGDARGRKPRRRLPRGPHGFPAVARRRGVEGFPRVACVEGGDTGGEYSTLLQLRAARDLPSRWAMTATDADALRTRDISLRPRLSRTLRRTASSAGSPPCGDTAGILARSSFGATMGTTATITSICSSSTFTAVGTSICSAVLLLLLDCGPYVWGIRSSVEGIRRGWQRIGWLSSFLSESSGGGGAATSEAGRGGGHGGVPRSLVKATGGVASIASWRAELPPHRSCLERIDLHRRRAGPSSTMLFLPVHSLSLQRARQAEGPAPLRAIAHDRYALAVGERSGKIAHGIAAPERSGKIAHGIAAPAARPKRFFNAPSADSLRCIHVGLLCHGIRRRDANSRSITLPVPAEPAFMTAGEWPRASAREPSIREVSVSDLEPRCCVVMDHGEENRCFSLGESHVAEPSRAEASDRYITRPWWLATGALSPSRCTAGRAQPLPPVVRNRAPGPIPPTALAETVAFASHPHPPDPNRRGVAGSGGGCAWVGEAEAHARRAARARRRWEWRRGGARRHAGGAQVGDLAVACPTASTGPGARNTLTNASISMMCLIVCNRKVQGSSPSLCTLCSAGAYGTGYALFMF
ncbi:hypothetical protein HU200_024109 [Digitaria exilis]|uniref:Uncharacterized protein n=1 Tax=Digitaria exilis TaxID=1010633 RepID=A0A835C410_9POAL|nr:hypothetical protein HU200_024109 [Digitaria exilis]